MREEISTGYVNFDDEHFIDLNIRDLDKVLQGIYELYGNMDRIILDEPQNVCGWELFVNRLRRTQGVIVTAAIQICSPGSCHLFNWKVCGHASFSIQFQKVSGLQECKDEHAHF